MVQSAFIIEQLISTHKRINSLLGLTLYDPLIVMKSRGLLLISHGGFSDMSENISLANLTLIV